MEHLTELDDVDIRRVDVNVNQKSCAAFYLADRTFTDSELRLIIDSLSGNCFISDTETQDLIQRVASLSSRHFRNKIGHYKFINDRGKTTNSTIIYNLEQIEDAITEKKKIIFNPVRTNKAGQQETSFYYRAPLTPVQTIVQGQRYYLLYLDEGRLGSYPITRMANVEIVDEPAENVQTIWPNGIDYNRLLREHPDLICMHHKAELCTFRCSPSMLNDIKAYFGSDLRISPVHQSRTITFRDGKQDEISEDMLDVSVITDTAAAMQFAWENLDTVWLIAPAHTNCTIRKRLEYARGYYDFLEDTIGAGIEPKVLKDRSERDINHARAKDEA
jgi:hypothetical protein